MALAIDPLAKMFCVNLCNAQFVNVQLSSGVVIPTLIITFGSSAAKFTDGSEGFSVVRSCELSGWVPDVLTGKGSFTPFSVTLPLGIIGGAVSSALKTNRGIFYDHSSCIIQSPKYCGILFLGGLIRGGIYALEQTDGPDSHRGIYVFQGDSYKRVVPVTGDTYYPDGGTLPCIPIQAGDCADRLQDMLFPVGPDYTANYPTIFAGPVRGGACAYDPNRNKLIFHGGVTNYFRQTFMDVCGWSGIIQPYTWELDLTLRKWIFRECSGPTTTLNSFGTNFKQGVYYHNCLFIPKPDDFQGNVASHQHYDKIVMFGGLMYDPGTGADSKLNQNSYKWDFDANEWGSGGLNPPPGKKFYYGMAACWDKRMKRLVIVGGYDDPLTNSVSVNQTLFYYPSGVSGYESSGTWVVGPLLPYTGGDPVTGSRAFAGLAYDETIERCVLFGGERVTSHGGTPTYLDTTMILDLNDDGDWIWRAAVGDVAGKPLANSRIIMHFNPNTRVINMYGGQFGTKERWNVFEPEGEKWLILATSPTPTLNRTETSICYWKDSLSILAGGRIPGGYTGTTFSYDSVLKKFFFEDSSAHVGDGFYKDLGSISTYKQLYGHKIVRIGTGSGTILAALGGATVPANYATRPFFFTGLIQSWTIEEFWGWLTNDNTSPFPQNHDSFGCGMIHFGADYCRSGSGSVCNSKVVVYGGLRSNSDLNIYGVSRYASPHQNKIKIQTIGNYSPAANYPNWMGAGKRIGCQLVYSSQLESVFSASSGLVVLGGEREDLDIWEGELPTIPAVPTESPTAFHFLWYWTDNPGGNNFFREITSDWTISNDPDNPRFRPTPRRYFAAVSLETKTSKPYKGYVVMFGGEDQFNPGTYNSETWVLHFDGADNQNPDRWELVDPSLSAAYPSSRIHPTMTYDEDRNVVIMHGGTYPGGGISDETWEFDPETYTWTLVSGSGPAGGLLRPPVTQRHACAFDPDRRVLVYFPAGSDTFYSPSDIEFTEEELYSTYMFDLTTRVWSKFCVGLPDYHNIHNGIDYPTKQTAIAGTEYHLVYDPVRKEMLLFCISRSVAAGPNSLAGDQFLFPVYRLDYDAQAWVLLPGKVVDDQYGEVSGVELPNGDTVTSTIARMATSPVFFPVWESGMSISNNSYANAGKIYTFLMGRELHLVVFNVPDVADSYFIVDLRGEYNDKTIQDVVDEINDNAEMTAAGWVAAVAGSHGDLFASCLKRTNPQDCNGGSYTYKVATEESYIMFIGGERPIDYSDGYGNYNYDTIIWKGDTHTFLDPDPAYYPYDHEWESVVGGAGPAYKWRATYDEMREKVVLVGFGHYLQVEDPASRFGFSSPEVSVNERSDTWLFGGSTWQRTSHPDEVGAPKHYKNYPEYEVIGDNIWSDGVTAVGYSWIFSNEGTMYDEVIFLPQRLPNACGTTTDETVRQCVQYVQSLVPWIYRLKGGLWIEDEGRKTFKSFEGGGEYPEVATCALGVTVDAPFSGDINNLSANVRLAPTVSPIIFP